MDVQWSTRLLHAAEHGWRRQALLQLSSELAALYQCAALRAQAMEARVQRVCEASPVQLTQEFQAYLHG